MTTQEVKRKLAAIFSADVKGYSRLMGEDEKGTVRTLNTYKEVMIGLIQHHRGRVVDAPGDNVLAEFASVVDAVECAVEIQKELKTRNAELPENRKMEFRIGVNLGDVIEDGEQILGDGVNIAARLESLSEAGGICISGTAFDQVRNKLELGYDYLGEQTVKNIALPVRVYKVLMEPEEAGKLIGEKKAKPRRWQRTAIGLVVVVIVVAAATAIWKYYTPSTLKMGVASKEKMAFPLPDKPSIAVLPFTNMSGEKEQEYFADGLVEGIINGLSKSEHIFVIARNSTFTYKGKPVKVKQVAEEMGVQYVMEGSVQREGNRVRITVQLIDALTGRHLFSERYDRDLKDILILQDEITMKVLTAVQVKLTGGEDARLRAKGTKNLDAYLKLSEAREHYQIVNKENQSLARQLAEEAIALDPQYSAAYAFLANVTFTEVFLGVYKNPREALERAIEQGKKAVAMDDSSSTAHAALSFPYVALREHEKALLEAEKAVSLEPNSASAHHALGTVLLYSGRFEEAIAFFKKSLRLSPIPVSYNVLVLLGRAYCLLGQYKEAVATINKLLQLCGPDHLTGHLVLAATYVLMGREKEAYGEAAEVMRIDPKFSLESYARNLPFKDRKIIDDIVSASQKAGLK
jgi:adenylate cyclase